MDDPKVYILHCLTTNCKYPKLRRTILILNERGKSPPWVIRFLFRKPISPARTFPNRKVDGFAVPEDEFVS